MIRKYRYGTPFNTEALKKIPRATEAFSHMEVSQEEGCFTYIMDEDDIVYECR